jgi:hypothetical protein
MNTPREETSPYPSQEPHPKINVYDDGLLWATKNLRVLNYEIVNVLSLPE